MENRQLVGICCMTQGAQIGALGQPRGGDGVGGGKKAQEGGGICIPVADSWWCMPETTQHCKAVILQLEKKNKEKIDY